ncbi:hypothetical protein F5Y18DRAFT_423727 [Xylariaceae sp. FL1019]|nr:hypothetical protein F5Y18DRAFT_423727 [Xylariaceae sp. FL1019]
MSKPPPSRGHSRSALGTGSNEQLTIFEDELNFAPGFNRAPMPSVSAQHGHERALQEANANKSFYPPTGSMKLSSPSKANRRPRTSLGTSHNSQLNRPRMPPPPSNGQVTDSMQKGGPVWSVFKTHGSHDKENAQQSTQPTHCDASSSASTGQCQPKSSGKRTLLEAAHIESDPRPEKKQKTKVIPYTEYDENGKEIKPRMSYAQMISRAILESPDKRLTLNQIYNWIDEHFTYFKNGEGGWQNSIRHNLSLNKSFTKKDRAKDDPGKGGNWMIVPGCEEQFLNPPKDTRKKPATPGANVQVMSMAPRPEIKQDTRQQMHYYDSIPQLPALPPQSAAFQLSNASYIPSAPSGPAQSIPEISSDATIPLSDNVCGEDDEDENQVTGTPRQIRSGSPMPQTIQSSPPVPSFTTQHAATPSRSQSATLKPRVAGQKRKHASMDASNTLADSGYLSSMSSSVPRQYGTRDSSSVLKRVRNVKGPRAEEAIQLLRNSSSPYDHNQSPTRMRPRSYTQPQSSSPLRDVKHRQMAPPVTPMPANVATAPQVASASPTANLEAHRRFIAQMCASPESRQDSLAAGFPLIMQNSPGLDYTFPFAQVFDADLWTQPQPDMSYGTLGPSDSILVNYNGSPVKRRTKNLQASLGSAGSPASAHKRSVTSAPALPYLSPHVGPYQSPSKLLEGLSSSPSKTFLQPQMNDENDILGFATAIPEWDAPASDVGFDFSTHDYSNYDITAGFAKIGGNTNAASTARATRPGLGRSHTIR